MTITMPQAGAAHASSGAATVSLGSTPTVGNLLLCAYGDNSNTSSIATTPPTGFTYLTSRLSGATTLIGIGYRIVQSGDGTSWAWTPTAGSGYDLLVAEFAGLTAATPDTVTFGDSSSTAVTTQTAGTLPSMNGTGDLMFAAYYASATITTPSHSNSFAQVAIAASGGRVTGSWAVAGSQSGQTTALTIGSAAKIAAALVSFSPVALATGPAGMVGTPA